MSVESLVVALVVLVILCFVNQKIVPAQFQQIGWVVIAGIAIIWLARNLRALLHCCAS